MLHILKCQKCGTYSLHSECQCGGTALIARPPSYSPDDKYAEYRRKAKERQ